MTITVTINGDPQKVLWGENVEIVTAEYPDVQTGCTGIRFDFPLDKQIGEMQVCLIMNSPYSVGPANVCMYGGGVTATGLQICGPTCCSEESCETIICQKETICVPVKVTPNAKTGTVKIVCCGKPMIRNNNPCTEGQSQCELTITQNIYIEIPISFDAEIVIGTVDVQCHNL